MSPRAVILTGMTLLAACGFDRRSPGLDCANGQPCPAERMCVEGWCVLEGIDAGAADGADFDAASSRLAFGERADSDVSGVTFDTWIDSSNPTFNRGGADSLRLDRSPGQVGLLRFDLTAIAAGATVEAAEVRVFTETGFGNDGQVALYALNEAWVAGDLDGVAGQANWTQRMMDVPWTGVGATGGSRAGTVSDDAPARDSALELVFTLPVEQAQGWLDDPASNHGWVLVPVASGNSAATLVSSESSMMDRRPLMVVTYR